MHPCFARILTYFGMQRPMCTEFRTVFVNHKAISSREQLHEVQYPANQVVTSRYTAYNFLIKNLLEQFSRVANFYFLIVAIIQLLNDAPVSPTSSFVPLGFVLGATAIKQAYEDIKRHRSDNAVNSAPVKVTRGSTLVDIRSSEIQVGDIVRVHQNEGFPCDLVLLSSSEDTGECRVTTANLDGESNLKTVHSVELTRHLRTAEKIGKNLRAQIDCEQPTADLYKFKGNMKVRLGSGPVDQVSLSVKNVLLRGAILRNTEQVMGVAVYTGQETKMQLNSQSGRSKKSVIEHRVDNFLACFMGILLALVVLCISMKWSYANHKTTVNSAWYLPVEHPTFYRIVQDILGYVVLFNYLIPIALYVTMEVMKFIGSKFIEYDLNMYFEDQNTGEKMPAKANTSDLIEELGQVQHLFSDKTGTLTENKMTFRHCSVDERTFSELEGQLWETMSCGGQPLNRCRRLEGRQLLFFTALALCHTVRVERSKKFARASTALASSTYSALDATGYTYQAISPDEKAFVEAARSFGVIFHGTDGGVSTVSWPGDDGEFIIQQFRVLHVLEFDSDRKCMSVIVQRPDGVHWLISKGAESSMLEKCSTGDRDAVVKFSAEFAVQGLRVLAIAHRELSEAEFNGIASQLLSAERDVANREARLTKVYMTVEQGLEALGLTAIEDELQSGVRETLTDLRDAGIKVWVLTGDKRETAENISLSAGHISEGMQRIRIIEQHSAEDCTKFVASGHEEIAISDQSVQFCVIVDGQSLQFMLADENSNLRASFLGLCCRSAAILCCRCTPLQKSRVVAMVKEGIRPRPTTCAIGDGANDVSMIREAHVGIGIFGKEGRAAALNADYAYAKFKFTRTILLFHGHLFYVRLSTLVLYFFYKSIVFVMPHFFYAFFSGFSMQPMYDTAFFILYNMTMTSMPIFLYGLFEQHLPRHRLQSEPRLYQDIAHNRRLSWSQLALWSSLGLWHSVCCFFAVAAVFLVNDWVGANGFSFDVYAFGTLVITGILACVTGRILLVIFSFNLPTLVGILFSITTYVILLSAYSSVSTAFLSNNLTYYWTYFDVCRQPSAWLLLLCATVLGLTPDLIIRFVQDSRTDLMLRRRTTASEVSSTSARTANRKWRSQLEAEELEMDPSWFEFTQPPADSEMAKPAGSQQVPDQRCSA